MPHIVPQLHRASRHYEDTSFAPEKEWTINFTFGSLKTIWTDSAPWNLAPTAALRALNARMMPRNLTQHGKWNAWQGWAKHLVQGGTASGSALAQKRHRSAQNYEPGSDQHSAYTHKLVAKKKPRLWLWRSSKKLNFLGWGMLECHRGAPRGGGRTRTCKAARKWSETVRMCKDGTKWWMESPYLLWKQYCTAWFRDQGEPLMSSQIPSFLVGNACCSTVGSGGEGRFINLAIIILYCTYTHYGIEFSKDM